MDHHPAAGWTIRACDPGCDREGCERVFAAFVSGFSWLPAAPESLPDRWWAGSGGLRVLVANVAQAGIVGFIMFNSGSGYVAYLLVDVDWRLCGIGRGLLDQARGLSDAPLSLDVDRDNHRARAAYAAFGFRPVRAHETAGRRQIRMVAAAPPDHRK